MVKYVCLCIKMHLRNHSATLSLSLSKLLMDFKRPFQLTRRKTIRDGVKFGNDVGKGTKCFKTFNKRLSIKEKASLLLFSVSKKSKILHSSAPKK